jgi:hypothetical protein
MNIDTIRKVLRERPFRPVVFHFENGEKQLIKHPEIIVTEINIVAVDDDGLLVFIKPEAVTAIHYARNNKARRARGRKRTPSRR